MMTFHQARAQLRQAMRVAVLLVALATSSRALQLSTGTRASPRLQRTTTAVCVAPERGQAQQGEDAAPWWAWFMQGFEKQEEESTQVVEVVLEPIEDVVDDDVIDEVVAEIADDVADSADEVAIIEPAAAAAPAPRAEFSVTIPPYAEPGRRFLVRLPDNTMQPVVTPAENAPGDQITIRIPAEPPTELILFADPNECSPEELAALNLASFNHDEEADA